MYHGKVGLWPAVHAPIKVLDPAQQRMHQPHALSVYPVRLKCQLTAISAVRGCEHMRAAVELTVLYL